MAETLDELVKRVDPDRWLAARFAPAERRAGLIALYALNYELARVGETVSNPMLGEIRLAWWREGLEAGERRHPVLEALAPLGARLEHLPDARQADLEPAPFRDEAALLAWIDGTAGAVMEAAATLLDPASPPGSTVHAARAWAWSGLVRAEPAWRARGRRWTPDSWADADEDEMASHVGHRIDEALTLAADELKALPVAAFPAVAYVTLVRAYRRHEPGELEKRGRLLAATMRGRI